jgi:UDP-arabinose 4-epimerase
MCRILLTGGAGFIGSHTAKCLARAGFEPVTLDNLSTGHSWAVKWGPLVPGDIADRGLVRDIISRYRIEAVLHFAAYASVGESMQDPRKYFQNNVASTLNLFDSLLDSSVKSVIFSSSCATYGTPEHTPITERHPQSPINPYGESKLMIEKALRWYGEAYGLSLVCLRYFNAAGADPDGEIGEAHNPETHLIPLTIEAAMRTDRAVEVFGADYATSDGTAVRDYTHVTDLAEAHVLALEYLLNGGASDAFNLGTGRGHSVLDVIDAVARVSGHSVRLSMSPRRPGDPAILVADPSRARAVLGWQAEFTDLEEIVRTAWNWYRAGPVARAAAAG